MLLEDDYARTLSLFRCHHADQGISGVHNQICAPTFQQANPTAIFSVLHIPRCPSLILMAALLPIVALAVAQNSLEDFLALSLTSAKVHYFGGENVTLTITFENRSPHDITLNKRMANPGPDLIVDIEDVMGNRLRWLPAAPPPMITTEDFTVLSAGQKLEMLISVLQIGLFDKLKREQKYRMTVRYQNTETGGKFNYAAWTGSITSNTILFEWEG